MLAWLATPRNRRASISGSGRRFDSKPSRQWQLRGAEGGFSRWRQGRRTDEDSNDRRSIAGRRKAPVPAGHYKSSPGDKPLASKNGAAEFTRRAVARALQEGTRARTSGGAARRGSDVGERQPDPGSPRLPEVRARRLLIQRSRRADVRGCRHEMDFRVISRRKSLLALLSLSVMLVPRITAKACREYTLASAVKTKEL